MDSNSTPARRQLPTPQVCPKCGTSRLRAVYGLPKSELANDPTVKLMGCMIDGEMKEWSCPMCER